MVAVSAGLFDSTEGRGDEDSLCCRPSSDGTSCFVNISAIVQGSVRSGVASVNCYCLARTAGTRASYRHISATGRSGLGGHRYQRDRRRNKEQTHVNLPD